MKALKVKGPNIYISPLKGNANSSSYMYISDEKIMRQTYTIDWPQSKKFLADDI